MDAEKNTFLIPLVSALLLSLALSACAVSPPVQEMSDARQAIQAAAEVDANKHAPDSMRDAEVLMGSASRHLEEGDFRAARRAALKARLKAIQARDRALAADDSQ